MRNVLRIRQDVRRRELKSLALPKEFERVVVDDFLDLRFGVTAFAESFEEVGDGDVVRRQFKPFVAQSLLPLVAASRRAAP